MVFENEKDWPDKYEIHKLVTREKSVEMIISGQKLSERRNDRYADIGDEILLNGHLFIVENVYPQHLRNMTEENARDEGYENLATYKEAIESIHKAAVWDPDQIVWAHYLKEK